MSDMTFGMTSEDVRKLESKEAKSHGGQISKDSDAAIMKQIIAENSDPDRIDKVKANLPLPEQPLNGKAPPPDFNSLDARTVNVGSGGVDVKLGTGSSNGLREPATAESSARIDGKEWHKPTAP